MPPVVIANQRKRLASWGRDGTMRLNWRPIQLPDWLVDYVVVRLLLHLQHRGRGPGFQQTIERVMPNWRYRRERLQWEEPALFW